MENGALKIFYLSWYELAIIHLFKLKIKYFVKVFLLSSHTRKRKNNGYQWKQKVSTEMGVHQQTLLK